MIDSQPGSLQTGDHVYHRAEPVLSKAKLPPVVAALKAFRPCFIEIRGLLVLNPTPISSPLVQPLMLLPKDIILELPLHPTRLLPLQLQIGGLPVSATSTWPVAVVAGKRE